MSELLPKLANPIIDPEGIYFVESEKGSWVPIRLKYPGEALLIVMSANSELLDGAVIYKAERIGTYHIIKSGGFELEPKESPDLESQGLNQ